MALKILYIHRLTSFALPKESNIIDNEPFVKQKMKNNLYYFSNMSITPKIQ
jgi:hypothetical protein